MYHKNMQDTNVPNCLFIRVRIENVTDDFGVMVKLH